MKRPELARITLLLLGGAGLVWWLVYATRPEAQVHALEAQHAKSTDASSLASTNQSDTDSSTTEAETAPVSNETEPVEIVPGTPRAAARRAPIENVAGPEPLPGLTPVAVLQNMRSVVRDYGARFGGNPFGNNREITAKLNGGNPNQIVFLKEEDGMRLNQRGELIDNWGTPFFFHQISGTEMEIRSAGPDRKMWTADDLVLK
jgi:hypothetical protein